MDLEEVDIVIEPDGRVRVEVRGVKGAGCLALTEALEQALGGQIVSRDMTPEAGENSVEQQTDSGRAQNGA